MERPVRIGKFLSKIVEKHPLVLFNFQLLSTFKLQAVSGILIGFRAAEIIKQNRL